MTTKKHWVAALGLIVSGALGAGACLDVQQEYCDALCACQNCGDTGRDRCDTSVNSQIEIADVYGCAEHVEEFFACATQQLGGLSKEQCAQETLPIDLSPCTQVQANYARCVDDASARDPGAYP